MKIYQLFIETNDSKETYNCVTKLLGLEPTEGDNSRVSQQQYASWMYVITESEDDPYFDFINSFLDTLEPKFADLEKLGITKDKILFWMLYEYDQQCGLEFNPQEMARLGNSGIHLNIDCWEEK